MNADTGPAVPTELTAVLDELIDVIAEIKQARWLTSGPAKQCVNDVFDHLVTAVATVSELDARYGAPRLPVRTPSARSRAPLTTGPDHDVLTIVSADLHTLSTDIASHANTLEATAPDAAAALHQIAKQLLNDAKRLEQPN